MLSTLIGKRSGDLEAKNLPRRRGDAALITRELQSQARAPAVHKQSARRRGLLHPASQNRAWPTPLPAVHKQFRQRKFRHPKQKKRPPFFAAPLIHQSITQVLHTFSLALLLSGSVQGIAEPGQRRAAGGAGSWDSYCLFRQNTVGHHSAVGDDE